jgi:hypothetical protein
MNLLSSLAQWFGLTAVPPMPNIRPVANVSPPALPPAPTLPTPPRTLPVNRTFDAATVAARRLDVRKALSQCDFIGRSYGVRLWTRTARRADWEADLLTMHLHDDLAWVRLLLVDAADRIVFEFRVDFDCAAQGPLVDSARGIELPVLGFGVVRGRHMEVEDRKKGRETYRHLLRVNWETASSHGSLTTDQFESEHAGRISAGRQKGYFSVAGARHRLLVTHVSPAADYAFGDDTELKTQVFLHAKFAPPGLAFRRGQAVTAVVVQTPRGPQGRNIAQA